MRRARYFALSVVGLRGRDELVSLRRGQVARDAVFNLFYPALPAFWLECMVRKAL